MFHLKEMKMGRWSQSLPVLLYLIIFICSKTKAQFASGYSQFPSEIFFLKLEDGYFGCQVNDSTQVLKLFPISKLCDGVPQCFRGSDELQKELKCTDKRNCHPRKPLCESGACLDNLCYCNDGYGGKGCEMPDENECKYRPCDVFAHCTNTMGSFYCSCYPGYEGDGFNCKDINECEDPVLASRCVENADCCNLPAHYKCKCKPGFEGDGTVECRDIDECALPNTCGAKAVCENTVGSYICKCQNGYSGDAYAECIDKQECSDPNTCARNAKCKEMEGTYKCYCPPGFSGDPYAGGCIDVNECQINPTACGRNSECANTPGSYACRCKQGFTGDPFKGCEDINECPAACGANSNCVNLDGSYECSCKVGFYGNPYLSAGCSDLNECDKPDACSLNAQCTNVAGSFKCRCLPGFTGQPERFCEDVNECLKNPCDKKAVCQNTPGSFICKCGQGYTGDPYNGCQDINECVRDRNICGKNAICENVPGSFICKCPMGYNGNADVACERVSVKVECRINRDCVDKAECIDGRCHCIRGYRARGSICADVDECLSKPCGVNARCINTLGSYECTCIQGRIGDPYAGCKTLCDDVNCGPHAVCMVMGKEAQCHCDQGYMYKPTDIALGCLDINECDTRLGPSGLCGDQAKCTNNPGSFKCTCPVGFTGDPQKSCYDINECSPQFGKTGKCGFNALCKNTPGSYSCACPSGTTGDPFKQCNTFLTCRNNTSCPGNSICTTGSCFCPTPNFGSQCRHPCDDVFCGDNAVCQVDNGRPICACASGYTGNHNSLTGCVDINECLRKPCGKDAVCRNILGTYECICPLGYTGDPYKGCLLSVSSKKEQCSVSNPCPRYEKCVDTGITKQCVCKEGYIRDKNQNCRDINECTENIGRPACAKNSRCVNQPGSYECFCKSGFTGNAYISCSAVDIRCKNNQECPGNTLCSSIGGDKNGCGCPEPYNRFGHYCILTSQNCSTLKPCPGNQDCIYTGPNYGFCVCPRGYTLDVDGKCRDIDECIELPDKAACGPYQECVNMPGTYECRCSSGFSKTPTKGCRGITIECELNAHCPDNFVCKYGSCQCPPPYMLRDKKCRHPCDWITCGPHSKCVLGRNGPKCSCAPGFKTDRNGGCWDINECTAKLPADPNGPCAIGATCINTVGSYVCQCHPGSGGDPYKKGCRGTPRCRSSSQCPTNAMCDINSGRCIDPCRKAVCGPNTYCVAKKHRPFCVCRDGFKGDSTDVRIGCVSLCKNHWCGKNARCVGYNNKPVCKCPVGFIGNPYPGGICRHVECDQTKSCSSGYKCVNYKCVQQCADVTCGVGAYCKRGKCQCYPLFIGDPNFLCVPPILPPVCVPGCGLNAHCSYGIPNKCICNPGMSGNPYAGCSLTQTCQNTRCGTNANCIQGVNRIDCICRAGYQGNPFQNCLDVNECLGSPCGVNAQCINSIGSFQCVCPAGLQGNPTISCLATTTQPTPNPTLPNVCEGPDCVCTSNNDCRDNLVCQGGDCVVLDRCVGIICGINAFCTNGICECEVGTAGDPNIECDAQEKTTCEEDDVCDLSSVCRTNSEGLRNCFNVCDSVDCGENAACLANDRLPICECLDGFKKNKINQCVPVIPDECKEFVDCPDSSVCVLDSSNIKVCEDACKREVCGPNAECVSSNHHSSCICIAGFAGDANDLLEGCQIPHICETNAQCLPTEVCKAKPDNIRDCHHACLGVRCGINAECVAIGHTASCVCISGFVGDAYTRCKRPNICEQDYDCERVEHCQFNNLGIKDCISACSGVQCGPNAKCIVLNHVPICKCLPNYIGIPSDKNRGCYDPNECQTDLDCPTHSMCRPQTGSGIKKCIDVCTTVQCGKNAHCSAIEHQATCVCIGNNIGNPEDLIKGCYPPDKCKSDSDCQITEACRTIPSGIKDCVDICLNYQCGVNAECKAENHNAKCVCRFNYVGDPYEQTGCRHPDKCKSDFDCLDDEACREQPDGIRDCIKVCYNVRCGINAKCRPIHHQAVCKCINNYVGNADDENEGCKRPDKCRVNSDCPGTKQCRPRDDGILDCIDACQGTQCGPYAECQSLYHSGECKCRNNYVGNPYDLVRGCRPPHECFTDNDCPETATCEVNDVDKIKKCFDVCKEFRCGQRAHCYGSEHRAACVCSGTYVGDPYDRSDGCVSPNKCEIDSDCPGTHSCRIGSDGIKDCINVCYDINCGVNAHCHAKNHIGSCQCILNYIGDPTIRCRVPDKCTTDHDCAQVESCQLTSAEIKDCINVCIEVQCGPNAYCYANNHDGQCKCLNNYIGDPNDLSTGCYSPDKCQNDFNCLDTHVCRLGSDGFKDCINVCNGVVCGNNAQCHGIKHNAQCKCIGDYTGDPINEGCRPPDLCKRDADCPSVAACRPTQPNSRKKCINVCLDVQCGPNAQCTAIRHRPKCVCSNSQHAGNPNDLIKGCYRPDKCRSNADCAETKACRLTSSGIKDCIDVCKGLQCGLNANCIAANHRADCKCMLDYVGNPHDLAVGCEVPDKCFTDDDCTDINSCRRSDTGIKDCHNVCKTRICGPNAYCEARNHIATCVCESNFVGNPEDRLFGCRQPNKCEIDSHCLESEACRRTQSGIKDCIPVCLAISCGPNAECYAVGHFAVCKCRKNFVGDPEDVIRGCYPPHKCKTDLECSLTAACKPRPLDGIRECMDVCTTAQCGPNAQCISTSHHPVCLCIRNYIGNPNDLNRGCYPPDKCTTDLDCLKTQACRPHPTTGIKDCFRVCQDYRCGPNADCVAINHVATCKCVSNYVGTPKDLSIGCSPPDKCKRNSDCNTDEACRPAPSGIKDCFAICPEIQCGPYAKCYASNHVASCRCIGNYVGYPDDLVKGCHPPDKCITNAQCSTTAVCQKLSSGIKDCVDACQTLRCGNNARCIARNHKGSCQCIQGYVGDASSVIKGCHLPHECTVDHECADHQVCKSDVNGIRKCGLACLYVNCASNADCVTQNHKPQCVCPAGYTGNAYTTGCKEIDLDKCKRDEDCHSSELCRADLARIKKCISGCTTRDCGPDAICSTINHLPTCRCPPGYTGDAYNLVNGCKPPKRNECERDTDCSDPDVCKPNNSGILKCAPACLFMLCGPNAACFAKNHVASCQCKATYVGDAFNIRTGCKPREPDQCKENNQCPSFQSCKPSTLGIRKCADVCLDFSCPPRSGCIAVYHAGECQCEPGYTGNPLDRLGCIPIDRNDCDANDDCSNDADECDADQQGIRRCLDACRYTQCGPNAICVSQKHFGVCKCPAGLYIGNPNDPIRGCIRVQCIRNQDCPLDKYCARGNVCKNPCTNACKANSACIVENHRATCRCRPGYTGVPEVGCTVIRYCERKPCHTSAKCVDTPGSYSCFCPPNYIGDPYKGGCRHPNACPNGNADCPSNAACMPDTDGIPKCSNPCNEYKCGSNADCSVRQHQPTCYCPPGFFPFPDPSKLCIRVIKRCDNPRSCIDGQGCVHGQCRIFCSSDNDCARGEKCNKNQCVYGCFNHDDCPQGQACVTGYCKMGCKRDSDCQTDQRCIQNQCKNPCKEKNACGPNALCTVAQHRHHCTCPTGFIGNPTPLVGCKRVVNTCASSVVCPPGQICVENRCRVTCGECAVGELCYNNICLMLCTSDGNCPAGTICLNQVCQVGCRGDSDCGFNMYCMANKCKCKKGYTYSGSECIDYNECESNPCHSTALCLNNLGSYSCKCKEGYVGEPYRAPGCRQAGECPDGDVDCSPHTACGSDELGIPKCINPCDITDCGPNANCFVRNHQPKCECPKNKLYIGNAYDRSKGCIQVECLRDQDCSSDKKCLQNYCENPCSSTFCLNGICQARNHQAYCKCNPGFELQGDRCIDVNECLLRPCHTTAKCVNSPGSFSCQCPPGTVGNAFESPGCHDPNACFNGNRDCPSNAICANENGEPRCKNPCDDPRTCGINAQCSVQNHVFRCNCPPLYYGNPKVECKRVECVEDQECATNKMCLSNKCIDPCSIRQCGINTNCIAKNHQADCSCLPGYQGHPIQGCRRIITCINDEACPVGEFCKDSHCRLACHSNRECGSNERCVAGRCVLICVSNRECPSKYICDNGVCSPDLSKCFNDNECDDSMTCRLSNRGYNDCLDPCENTICGRNAICVSKGHIATCRCPDKYIGDPNDEFKGCFRPECIQDRDCASTKACSNHKCINPCVLDDPCGPNALCYPKNHQANCRCIDGYDGDVYTGCTPIDYCEKRPCHSSATCRSTIGSYTCSCPDSTYIGNAYNEPGCRLPHECPNGDPDCQSNAACRPQNKILMCINPCDDHKCGFNARCNVVRHQPQCSCPSGFTGNANDLLRGCYRVKLICSSNVDCNLGFVCHNSRCRPPCLKDSECAYKEICVQGKCILGCREDPDCFNSEICINNFCSVGCRENRDCLDTQACVANQCKNLCINNGVCGINAQCKAVQHKEICDCPTGFNGNANIICSRVIQGCTADSDCPLNHFCQLGRCKVQCKTDSECAINEKCFSNRCILICKVDKECLRGEICISNKCQIGCRRNSDCRGNEACSSNQCSNPCEQSSACGPLANCRVINHKVTCTCEPGFVGNPTPNIGCIRLSTVCTSKSDCPPGQYCNLGKCRVICGNDRDCVRNEQCFSGRCHVQCQRDRDCPSQEICNQFRCQVGCRTDTDCSHTEACIRNQCINPCDSPTQCGRNADCKVVNHQARCTCPPGLTGDARIQCSRLEVRCDSDDLCGIGSYCASSLCRVSCSNDNACLYNERCHSRQCTKICESDSACPPGYICKDTICMIGCRYDSDCTVREACIDRKCRNPCESPTACGTNAICTPANYKPRCTCPPRYTGTPTIACVKTECVIDSDCGTGKLCENFKCKVGCRRDEHCDSDKICSNRLCMNPCYFRDACGLHALCKTTNHIFRCSCREGYVGVAEIECFRKKVECNLNSQCPENYICQNNKCILKIECQTDFECGFGYICENFKCFSGCRDDSNCLYDQNCVKKQCQNPCDIIGTCGINAECMSQNHRAFCRCLPGYSGDARIQCSEVGPRCRANTECGIGQRCFADRCIIVTGCTSDNDCSNGEICHNTQCIIGCRSNGDCDFTMQCKNRLCQNPCDEIRACGTNALCRPLGHKAVCSCLPNYVGNAYIQCIVRREECTVDADCQQGRICVSNRCDVGCRSDTDCPLNKACVNRRCIPACSKIDACGVNALCRPDNHKAMCICQPPLTGDPHIECRNEVKYQCIHNRDCLHGYNCINNICILIAEGCQSIHDCNPGEICRDRKCIPGCRYDSECLYEEACHNARCVNPCNFPQVCGQNALCTPRIHRAYCYCPAGFIGNAKQICKRKPIEKIECRLDSECELEYICLHQKCIPGCRDDSRCPFDKACIGGRCQNPCSFPSACGINAECQPINHRPSCSCPAKHTGSPSVECRYVEIGSCKSDSDCGFGEICENGRCISACRSDENCPYDKACIYKRCQNPCSFYGACGKNANCQAANHKAVCHCNPPFTSGNPTVACTIERIDEECFEDHECLVGEYCQNNKCVPGCRTNLQCPKHLACIQYQCINPCLRENSCGTNAKCRPIDHLPQCTCPPDYTGDPRHRCSPIDKEICRNDASCPPKHICENGMCIVGCRRSEECHTTETCVNRRCQHACSIFLACGRNANCEARNHDAICTCPTSFLGNPKVECYKEKPEVECTSHSQCTLRHICSNNRCIKGCIRDSNCPYEEACIGGQCDNPCKLPNACGINAECRPIKHRPFCTCPVDHVGLADVECKPKTTGYCEKDVECPIGKICKRNTCQIGCYTDARCPVDEACIRGVCKNRCKLFGTCATNADCRTYNHDAVCSCPPGYTGDGRFVCIKVISLKECDSHNDCPIGQICVNGNCVSGCETNEQCPYDKVCNRRECIDPCQLSGVCGRNALCVAANHKESCFCPTGYTGDPRIECSKIEKAGCQSDSECGVGQICENHRCIVGCRQPNQCPFDKTCINKYCQNSCSVGQICGKGTTCYVFNHQAQCKCLPGFEGNPSVICSRVSYECEVDSDCGSGFVCRNRECHDINECLSPDSACAPSAICRNTEGSFRCSCPIGYIGNPYVEGCHKPKIGCQRNSDCLNTQACKRETGVCYNPCLRPDVCGKDALCRPFNHQAQCYCPPGYYGRSDVACYVKITCNYPKDCDGNLHCLNTAYCGCPNGFQRIGPYCTRTRMECTTNNLCPQNQRCIIIGAQPGFCICPRGFDLTPNGQCVDRNECESSPRVCGIGAKCINKAPGYECICPEGYLGNPYFGGCVKQSVECRRNEDCKLTQACDLTANVCINPCQNPTCGKNAICSVVNHFAVCSCPPSYTGDALFECYKKRTCENYLSCPGNLLCLKDGNCGCPPEFKRHHDYCLLTSVNCTTTDACNKNEECIYVGPPPGKCICPKGFELVNGDCVDFNECEKLPNICAQSALCLNNVGSYDCVCPDGTEGDPYFGNCNRRVDPGCTKDTDCNGDEKCDLQNGDCYHVCRNNPCGINSNCEGIDHKARCTCPPGYTGDPRFHCYEIVVCGTTFQCPGNTMCLQDGSCGCPPNLKRLGDYCILTSMNCSSDNPCPNNNRCVYTGQNFGFCACEKGFRLTPSGECVAINECVELAQPCGPGANCTDTRLAYECHCPPGTFGSDPYHEGCKIISCKKNDDCRSDLECHVESGECIPPCYICGKNAICTVTDHRATCECPPGTVGDPYDKQFGCIDEVVVKTPLPPGDMSVDCLADGVKVTLLLDSFSGIIYVKGHSNDAECRRVIDSTSQQVLQFKVLFDTCGLVHIDGEASFVLVIQKHPKLVTWRARAYHIKCVYGTGEKTITLGFNVSMITTAGTIANTGPPPTCLMQICTSDGSEVNSANIGDDLMLKLEVQPSYIYGGFARSCNAKTIENGREVTYLVTDENGCATDPTIFGQFRYDSEKKVLVANFNAFKFPSSDNIRFQCNVRVCFGACSPINCLGVDSYGRKKRQVNNDFNDGLSLDIGTQTNVDNEDPTILQTNGQDFEISVQSNAILTMEGSGNETARSTAEDPSQELSDEICLSPFSFIISLIITTLLALVAIAIAVACWLMAYRRKTKTNGPLPHPTDFPNPLYTTPEPVAEPTPDYLE